MPLATDMDILRSVKDVNVEYAESDWGSLSSNARDLVRKMLIKDPVQRCSARDCVEHVWMTSASQLGCTRVRTSLGLPTVRAVLERNGTSGTANSSPHAYEVGVLCPLDFPNMRERLCVCFLCFVHGNSGKPEEVRIEYHGGSHSTRGCGNTFPL